MFSFKGPNRGYIFCVCKCRMYFMAPCVIFKNHFDFYYFIFIFSRFLLLLLLSPLTSSSTCMVFCAYFFFFCSFFLRNGLAKKKTYSQYTHTRNDMVAMRLSISFFFCLLFLFFFFFFIPRQNFTQPSVFINGHTDIL